MEKPPQKKTWRERLFSRFYGKWPRRRIRPVLRIELTADARRKPKALQQLLNSHGYTGGDKIVVLLEKDFDRIATLAHTKVKNPIHQMGLLLTEEPEIQRILGAKLKVSLKG